jgi:hypothetical protein
VRLARCSVTSFSIFAFNFWSRGISIRCNLSSNSILKGAINEKRWLTTKEQIEAKKKASKTRKIKYLLERRVKSTTWQRWLFSFQKSSRKLDRRWLNLSLVSYSPP